MQCTDRYLALCSIPARMSRDGVAGANAHIHLPFHGFYFFSGQTYTFPGSQITQDAKTFVGGVSRPDTFKKEGAYCGGQV